MYSQDILRQIRDLLASLYSDVADARGIAENAELDLNRIDFTGKIINIWRNILKYAADHDKTETILHIAAREYPGKLIDVPKITLPPLIAKVRINSAILTICYQQCLSVRARTQVTAETSEEILNDLWDRPRQHNGHYPILEFVERLTYHVQEPIAIRELRQWIEQALPYISSELILTDIHKMRSSIKENIDSTPSPSYISVEIIPEYNYAQGHKLYSVEIAFWDHTASSPIIWYSCHESPVSKDEIPNKLSKTLVEKRSALKNKELILEFFLPFELLSLEVDQWANPLASTRGVTFGMDHCVVIRSYERVSRQLAWNLWGKKWRQFQRLADSYDINSTELIRWLYATDQYESLYLRNQILSSDNITCLGLTYTPTPESDYDPVLSPLLDTGMPIAFWPRPCNHTKENADNIQIKLKDICSDKSLSKLPNRVQEARRAAIGELVHDLANHVTLLWDEPKRIPLKYTDEASFPGTQ